MKPRYLTNHYELRCAGRLRAIVSVFAGCDMGGVLREGVVAQRGSNTALCGANIYPDLVLRLPSATHG